MKHNAMRRRIPVLSTAVDIFAVIVGTAWQALDDLADRLSRSRVAVVVGKVLLLIALVIAVALVTGCEPKNNRPGPIEITALEVQP